MSCAQVPTSIAAQQKSYVTYTAPTMLPDAPCITLLEAHSLIAASGTTGLRTWEAALHLGHYLVSAEGRQLINGKIILELGAGTGFLSILCAKHLGASYVIATDGSEEVIDDLASNIHLNGLQDNDGIGRTVLKWGHTLISSVINDPESPHRYNLLLGADVVSESVWVSIDSVPKMNWRLSFMRLCSLSTNENLSIDSFNNYHRSLSLHFSVLRLTIEADL